MDGSLGKSSIAAGNGNATEFGNVFAGKRVFITGHTGFKGAWLTTWLRRLGAEVTGFSLPNAALPPELQPTLFRVLGLEKQMRHIEGDITDFASLARELNAAKPDMVFHLAAQALVSHSYCDPRRTFEVNIGGTINLLEAIRHSDSVKTCVVVTSDKCYENREWDRGYREQDAMGGHDPYSASKGCAELVTASYRRSFFQAANSPRIATARAGNVIGGGDWSPDRLVPDFVMNILANRPLSLRNPHAIRPWQHVLEPLSGYLQLAAKLWDDDGHPFAEAWNFGPQSQSVLSVLELANLLCQTWQQGEVVLPMKPPAFHEANLLKLDSTKANTQLEWSPVWNVQQAVRATVEWYRDFSHGKQALALTEQQLDHYCESARAVRAIWTTPLETNRTWTNARKPFAAKSSNLRAS